MELISSFCIIFKHFKQEKSKFTPHFINIGDLAKFVVQFFPPSKRQTLYCPHKCESPIHPEFSEDLREQEDA